MISLLSHQAEFIQSNARHTGLVAGFGGGKSHAGVYKTITKKLKYPNIDVAYYLPTYGLIRDIAFVKFAEALDLIGLKYTLNKSSNEFLTPYGRIIMRSMDNVESIVGYEVGYSLVDEGDILPKAKMNEVFNKILARNRKVLPNNDVNSTDIVSTPEGYKFLYDFFVTRSNDNKKLIHAKTYDNPFLSKDYIASLLDSYSGQEIEAYLNGQFCNLTSGSVYNDYDRINNHTNRVVEANDILHVGMDFNITNMAAVIHVMDEQPLAVAEIEKAYDTRAMCVILKEHYPEHTIIVYPDSSGKNRTSSNGGNTDHDIIKSFGFKVMTPRQNPLIKDRVNTMNKAFRNGYKVNRFNCPAYSQGLEQISYKNDIPDKASGQDHITDAGGYFIWYQFGAKKATVYL